MAGKYSHASSTYQNQIKRPVHSKPAAFLLKKGNIAKLDFFMILCLTYDNQIRPKKPDLKQFET